MKKLLAVDGNSLVNRAFYGVKPLTTRDGRNTNAVFGFINMLKSQLDEVKPDYAAVAFDMRKPTFRHERYDFYKANRKGMPEELAEQFDACKSAAKFLGFNVVTCEGYEADDILGTLSKHGAEDIQVYLCTGDRDSYQLVGEYVNVLYVSTKETLTIDTKAIDEKYGVTPAALIEVKSLMGDTSDNIPGVKGIGEKTAIELVKKYGNIENLYENIEQADLTKSVKQKLVDGKDMAFASRFLAEINKNAPIDEDVESYKFYGIDKQKLCALCEDLELNSIINRLGLRETDGCECENAVVEKIEFKEIADVDEIENKEFSCTFSGQDIFVCAEDNFYKAPKTKENLEKILCDESKNVTLYDIKSVLLCAKTLGIDNVLCKFFDVMLASYVADPASVVKEENLWSMYGSAGIDTNDEIQKNLNGAKNLATLKKELEERIENQGQTALLYEIEQPLALVLCDMEHTGFLIDKDALCEYGKQLDEEIERRRERIYFLAGCEFNINSPKQLGEVLFEKMGLPSGKKTKSGYSTDAETLEKLRVHSPVIDEILEYRTVSKLKSTYVEGLTQAVGQDGRLHTSFMQALTLTGRLSSKEPNLQNIPIRTKEGREIRKVFIPKDGCVLIDADYSQIELRVMAAISGDENMIDTYKKGLDIHTSTASQVFDTPKEFVTGEMRKKAKAINFGIIYGISDFSLAGDMKVTKKQAGEYIKKYFEKYPDVYNYLEDVKKKAYEDGFVTTLYNRRRYIPELKSRIYMQRMFGERVAMNAPIQGSAADIIKIAMIKVYNRLQKEKLDAKLILQVHDELILEASQKDAEKAKQILVEEMTNAACLSVALEVDANIGENWESCHS